MSGLKARLRVILAGCLVIVLFLAYTFWPRAVNVDMGSVVRQDMMVTIDEEGKTQVRDTYIVSAPINGRLLRVDVEPGDPVRGEATVIAQMTPADPAMIDVRSEEQAKASVEAAQAALEAARAEVVRARADSRFAEEELDRMRVLEGRGIVSPVALDNAENIWQSASAGLQTANATVEMREAELANAKAMLMTFTEARKLAMASNPHPRQSLPIYAPASGQVLRVMQESETVIAAGTPLMEIGDPEGDLEVVAELLSTDAVKVSRDNRVLVEQWGGEKILEGRVQRIEPWAFTKFSALGVEEQRVRTVIELTGDPADYAALGHGFRVEVRIVTWEAPQTLTVPANAIFRANGGWAVFRVENGRASETAITIGRNNGVDVEILSGLDAGDDVILYPGNSIEDRILVTRRETG